MSLDDVLQRRGAESPLEREQFEDVVKQLVSNVRSWVERPQLDLQDWTVLVQYLDKRLNLPAITIHFADDQVTVQPRSYLAGRRPQVEVSSGARAALLEYVGDTGWMYRWEGASNPLLPVTENVFRDDILAELLR